MGAQSCFASPVCREGFLAQEAGGGWGGNYSRFAPWSCLSKRESFSPTPCLLTCQKTIQAIKPKEIRSRTGTGSLGCSLLSSHLSGTCFPEHHIPVRPGGGWDAFPPSPFSSPIQITNRGPLGSPSSKLPGLLFLRGGRIGRENHEILRAPGHAGAACTAPSWLRFPQHLLFLLNVIQRIQPGHLGLGFQKNGCLPSPPPPWEAGASRMWRSWVPGSLASCFLGQGVRPPHPQCPPRPYPLSAETWGAGLAVPQNPNQTRALRSPLTH